MDTSLVITVLNEEKTIYKLLQSIYHQSIIPSEVIIVDGGSTDKTLSIISSFKSSTSKKVNLRVFKKKGNRSIGRNYGIAKASGEVIAISDAGCILDKNWLKELVKPFKDKRVEVVAGNVKGIAADIFQKSLIPYVLVMQDKINKNDFLPASRSMAVRKTLWKRIGGFPESFSHNEDYVFAQRIKKQGIAFIFQESAITYWIPRKNLIEAFVMFFRFSLGDLEAGIVRPKVILIFVRYLAVLLLFIFFVSKSSVASFTFLGYALSIYIVWAIYKNYRYVNSWQASIYLPTIQVASDVAILLGSTIGLLRLLFKR